MTKVAGKTVSALTAQEPAIFPPQSPPPADCSVSVGSAAGLFADLLAGLAGAGVSPPPDADLPVLPIDPPVLPACPNARTGNNSRIAAPTDATARRIDNPQITPPSAF